jgi:hypothetical protein
MLALVGMVMSRSASGNVLLKDGDGVLGTYRLDTVRRRQPTLFVHWYLLPSTGRRTVGAV